MSETLSLGGTTPPAPEAPPQVEPQHTEAPQPQEQAGELIAGKFRSVQDLEKAYKSLERQFHERAGGGPIELDAVLDKAGVRGDDLVANWTKDGKLSDEQYASLQKVGFSQSVVDQFLAGQTALAATKVNAAQQAAAKAVETVGGPEAWASLTEWARSHYPPEKIADIDARLGDPKMTESAIKELLYDYRVVAGRGVQTNMVHGNSPPQTSAAYGTVEEVIEAMSRISKQGYVDEATKRRMAVTPKHLFQGVTR